MTNIFIVGMCLVLEDESQQIPTQAGQRAIGHHLQLPIITQHMPTLLFFLVVGAALPKHFIVHHEHLLQKYPQPVPVVLIQHMKVNITFWVLE